MKILRVIQFDNNVFYDYVKTNQGFAIQKNAKTIYGRLSGFGGLEIFEDCIRKYAQKHKIIEDDKKMGYDLVGTVGEDRI